MHSPMEQIMRDWLADDIDSCHTPSERAMYWLAWNLTGSIRIVAIFSALSNTRHSGPRRSVSSSHRCMYCMYSLTKGFERPLLYGEACAEFDTQFF
eukprot:scaffold29066_cov156-Amphora_coffeaeformis.AAC.2